jgi:hypothetical protein
MRTPRPVLSEDEREDRRFNIASPLKPERVNTLVLHGRYSLLCGLRRGRNPRRSRFALPAVPGNFGPRGPINETRLEHSSIVLGRS